MEENSFISFVYINILFLFCPPQKKSPYGTDEANTEYWLEHEKRSQSSRR